MPRKKNSCFDELLFSLVKNGKKYSALCEVCKKILTNTAASRLKAHRKICQLKRQHLVAKKSVLLSSRSKSRSRSRSDSDSSRNTNTNSFAEQTEEASEEDIQIVIVNDENDFNTESPQLQTVETESDNDGTVLAEYIFDKDTGLEVENNNLEEQSTPKATKTLHSTLFDKELPSSSMSSMKRSLKLNPSSEELSLSQMPTTPRITPSKRRMERNTIEKFMDNVTKEQTDDLNTKLSTFFFGCNIPFSVIDSDHFKNFIKALRPAYASKLPGRKALSTSLLDKEYQRCIDLSSDLMGSESVLLIDGWKNTSSNSKSVVSMLHNAKGSQAFLNAWDLTGESETSEKLTEILNESIVLAKELYKTDVYAVVSDNAAAMVKMGRNVPIWHSNCSSHTANLLAKDVMDLDLTKKVTAVLKEFKHADFERALVDKGGSRIKTPCDTRWCSYRDSYQCLVKNIHFMKTLIVDDDRFKKIKQTVKTLIFDDDFLDEVTDNIKLFDPICNLINFAQKSDSSSADVAHLWLSLQLPDKFIKFQDKLESRINMGLNIYAQLKEIQDFFLKNLDADGIMSYYTYQEKSGIFKTLFDKNITDPLVFWSMVNIHHPKLSSLALKLEKIPASSAQIERIFSNWSFVHSPLRNRLEFDRSRKLLHVYYTHKILDSNKSEDY